MSAASVTHTPTPQPATMPFPLPVDEGPAVRSDASGSAADPDVSHADAHADAHTFDPAHAAHPDVLRLRAVSLWCEGLRSPAIACQFGVPERTVRAWLAEARADFQADQGETPHETIALAVERQLAIAAAAWQSYHHAVELEQLALDYHRAQAQLAHDDAHELPLPPPPPRPSTAPACYLSVALAAQREAARLSGCYDLTKALAARQAQPQAKAEPQPLTYAQTRGLAPAEETAWDAFLAKLGLSPAHYAGPDDLDPLYRPAWEALRRRIHARQRLAAAAAADATPPADAAAAANLAPPPKTAETATAPTADRAESALDMPAQTATAPATDHAASQSPIPAETATAPAIDHPTSQPAIPAQTAAAPAPAPSPLPHPVASGSPFPPRREGGQGVRSAPAATGSRTRRREPPEGSGAAGKHSVGTGG